ncbi:hypothetical protein QFZ50_000243 [Arthrobacter agilis]|nr:hypothetical protein [Arthrobacter agilis]
MRCRHRSNPSPASRTTWKGTMTGTASGSSSEVAVSKPVNPIHRDDLHPVPPRLRATLEPVLEDLLGASLDHVQQTRRARLIADRSQVNDEHHVSVAAAGMPPCMLIHPDHGHPVEPVRVVDQPTLALGQDRTVRRMPGHPETCRNTEHGEVSNNQAFQRPTKPATGDLRPSLSRPRGVLPPGASAPGAPVAAHPHQQRLPSAPHDRHHGSASTTRHSITARSGSRCSPTASRPCSSSRQNVVRSDVAKVALSTSRSFG